MRRHQALGTSWYYKVSAQCHLKPKHYAVEVGKEKGHALFIERRVENPRGDKDYRQFGSYADVETLSECIGNRNLHMFEIMPPKHPVKLYLDFDQSPSAPGSINDCTRMLKAGHLEYFGMQLTDDQIFLSCATGTAEHGKWAGKAKISYHVVVNNGMAFPDVRACKKFVQAVYPNGFLDIEVPEGTEPPVDLAPYGSYQSFKMIHQSKTVSSKRVAVPVRGGWDQHLVTIFACPPMLYNMERLGDAVKEKVKRDGSTSKGNRVAIAPVHVNRAEQPRWVDPATVNPHSVADLLSYLPNHIDQPWELFFTVACICVNERAPFQIFDHWCQDSPKYDAREAESTYNGLEPRLVSSPGQPARTIATLRRIVEYCNPGIFEEATRRWVHQCMFPTVDFEQLGIKRKSYSSRYVKAFTQPWTCYPHLLLRAHMGTGKTTQAILAIEELRPSSVLIITPRQTLATSSMGVYKEALPHLVHYQQSARIEEEPFLVCQLESLWRVEQAYDMVILDESESILAQFSSETLTRFQAVTASFERIIQSASRTLWMDAFLADRTISICLDLIGNPKLLRYIENTHQSTCRTARLVGKGRNAKVAIKRTLQELADQGDRLVCVSASRQLLEEAQCLLPDPSLCITSKTPDNIKSGLCDANALWSQYDHIGYTGSITVGVNFDIRNYFDSLVMYFSAASTTVRDMMQSSMRVRHLQKERMFYATYPRYHGHQHFDVFNREKLTDIIDGRVEYQRNIKLAEDPLWAQRHELEPWLRQLWVFNQQERNISAFHMERLLEAYLELCGYTCDHTDLEELLEVAETIGALEDVAYSEVPSVGHAEFERRLVRMQRGCADEQDKLVIAKYILDNHMMSPDAAPEPEAMQELFKVFLKDQSEILRKLHNLQHEHKEPRAGSNVFQDNREAKAEHMRDICIALGVPHSQDVEAIIDRVTVHKTCQEILEKKEALRVAFGLRYQESGQTPQRNGIVKRGLEILNAMLDSWGFTSLQKHAKRKLVSHAGERKDETPYSVVARGRPKGAEHAKNDLCLRYLDVYPCKRVKDA
ncbi:hypothetical protein WJX84_004009 [Apatococcus fuscideae]|uniref:Replication origin-binding protein n=1 Tax=Apatococcus fuscideae TaxID=2026836 RepID=A0AAW1THS5_9CHLO